MPPRRPARSPREGLPAEHYTRTLTLFPFKVVVQPSTLTPGGHPGRAQQGCRTVDIMHQCPYLPGFLLPCGQCPGRGGTRCSERRVRRGIGTECHMCAAGWARRGPRLGLIPREGYVCPQCGVFTCVACAEPPLMLQNLPPWLFGKLLRMVLRTIEWYLGADGHVCLKHLVDKDLCFVAFFKEGTPRGLPVGTRALSFDITVSVPLGGGQPGQTYNSSAQLKLSARSPSTALPQRPSTPPREHLDNGLYITITAGLPNSAAAERFTVRMAELIQGRDVVLSPRGATAVLRALHESWSGTEAEGDPAACIRRFVAKPKHGARCPTVALLVESARVPDATQRWFQADGCARYYLWINAKDPAGDSEHLMPLVAKVQGNLWHHPRPFGAYSQQELSGGTELLGPQRALGLEEMFQGPDRPSPQEQPPAGRSSPDPLSPAQPVAEQQPGAPTAAEQQHAAAEQQHAAAEQQHAAAEQQHAAAEQQHAAAERQPRAAAQQPAPAACSGHEGEAPELAQQQRQQHQLLLLQHLQLQQIQKAVEAEMRRVQEQLEPQQRGHPRRQCSGAEASEALPSCSGFSPLTPVGSAASAALAAAALRARTQPPPGLQLAALPGASELLAQAAGTVPLGPPAPFAGHCPIVPAAAEAAAAPPKARGVRRGGRAARQRQWEQYRQQRQQPQQPSHVQPRRVTPPHCGGGAGSAAASADGRRWLLLLARAGYPPPPPPGLRALTIAARPGGCSPWLGLLCRAASPRAPPGHGLGLLLRAARPTPASAPEAPPLEFPGTAWRHAVCPGAHPAPVLGSCLQTGRQFAHGRYGGYGNYGSYGGYLGGGYYGGYGCPADRFHSPVLVSPADICS